MSSIFDHNEENYLKRISNPALYREQMRMEKASNPGLTTQREYEAKLSNPAAYEEAQRIKRCFGG